MTFVESLPFFKAKPKPKPQAKIPIKFPVITALKGLSTILNAKVVNTSPKPCGGLALAPTISKVNCTGNIKLSATATNAALMVPIKYNPTIGFKLASLLGFWFAIDEATKTNTKIGATAFNALTNKLPSIENDMARSGEARAKTTPKIMAIIIWFTILIDFSLVINEWLSGLFSIVIIFLI